MGFWIKGLDDEPLGLVEWGGGGGEMRPTLSNRIRYFFLVVTGILTLGAVVHHCGRKAKKIGHGNHWHSPTYKCRVCGLEFWTWTETG